MRSRWLKAALLAGLALACATPTGPQGPHPSLTALWRQYQRLPDERALAVAGDLDRVWVAAMAGGALTREDAVEQASVECRRKRRERRMQAPCLLYAVGDEIVWPVH